MDMQALSYLKQEISRSISPENLSGEKGGGALCPPERGSAGKAARDLGAGWKVNPYVVIQPGETFVMGDIAGSGRINHIWMTLTGRWRNSILRMYWDGQQFPSVECPAGDFFCMGWNKFAPLSSLAVCVNPGSAFNCYWSMPFQTRAKLTMTNIGDAAMTLYYQIDYCLCHIEPEEARFHAQFRRANPLPYKQEYVILDGVRGRGKYAGTYMAWGSNNRGWWGEGEIKFYLDGDAASPTVCGTGTEDYFCGSYNFEDPDTHANYLPFSTPYSGLHQVITPDKLYASQMRFGMYRWHITDPICFENDIRVTIQALGWREGNRYLPLQDDLASVAYWYQTLPSAPLSPLPDKDYLEVI